MPTLEQLREMLQAQANPSTQPTTHQEPKGRTLMEVLAEEVRTLFTCYLTAPGEAKALKGYTVTLLEEGGEWRIKTAHGAIDSPSVMLGWGDRKARVSKEYDNLGDAIRNAYKIIDHKTSTRGYAVHDYVCDSQPGVGIPASIDEMRRMVVGS